MLNVFHFNFLRLISASPSADLYKAADGFGARRMLPDTNRRACLAFVPA